MQHHIKFILKNPFYAKKKRKKIQTFGEILFSMINYVLLKSRLKSSFIQMSFHMTVTFHHLSTHEFWSQCREQLTMSLNSTEIISK